MVGGIITPIPYAPIDGPPSNGPQVSYALLARRAFFTSKGIMPLNVNATDHAADEALGLSLQTGHADSGAARAPEGLVVGWWVVWLASFCQSPPPHCSSIRSILSCDVFM